jgi:hypothetical protein
MTSNFLLAGKFDSVEKYSRISRERSKRFSYLFGLGRSANYLAEGMENTGKVVQAAIWKEESLRQFMIMDSIGDCFLDERYRKLPGYWWEAGYSLKPEETRNQARKEMYDKLRWLTGYYERQGDLMTALRYERRAMTVKDSLIRYRQAKDILGLEIQYETERKEKQIVLLSRENEMHQMQFRRTIWLVSGGGVFVLLMILFGLMWFRQKQLRDRQHALELEQRLMRTQMNPHFIFNSLASIQNFIVTQEPMKASAYLSRFANLVRSILDNSVEEFIPFDDEIKTIENYLALQKVRYEDKFDYAIEVDPAIDAESMMIPPMLAQPFIENSIEHGFKQKNTKGRLSIRIRKASDDLILFEVEDDGIGREKARQLLQSSDPKHRSMATSITRDRIAVLNRKLKRKITLGIIDLKDDAGNPTGTLVRFGIPVKT